MQPFPHRYEVSARATANGDVAIESHRLPVLNSAQKSRFVCGFRFPPARTRRRPVDCSKRLNNRA